LGSKTPLSVWNTAGEGQVMVSTEMSSCSSGERAAVVILGGAGVLVPAERLLVAGVVVVEDDLGVGLAAAVGPDGQDRGARAVGGAPARDEVPAAGAVADAELAGGLGDEDVLDELAVLVLEPDRDLDVRDGLVVELLDHADAALSAAFQGQLAARLPGLTAGLAGFSRPLPRTEFTDDAGFLRHQCGHRYWRLARQFEGCLTGERCARTPQIFLIDGARVGAVEGDLFIDQDCPGRVGFDAVAAFREIGREAAHVALEGLSAEWSVLADRLGLITEVAAALEDLCAPRRRRFSDEAIAGLQARFAGLGAALGSADLGLREGAWVIEDGLFHVPGLGPARQLARFAAGKGSPNSELRVGARRLRAEGLRAARCVGEAEGLPLALALYDAAGAPRFLGFFFAEELVCGELGPR
jgi:hypothetical protein